MQVLVWPVPGRVVESVRGAGYEMACNTHPQPQPGDNVDSKHILRSDDNGVNMRKSPSGLPGDAAPPATPRPYHHGDLRNALVEAGLQLLESRPQGELTLREVARAVGVSPTAVYRHFADLQALRTALAMAGLDRLAQAQRQATAQAGGGQAGFLASGLAYVRFAVGQPLLFRLVFSCAQPDDLLDSSADSMSAALRDLRQDIDALLPATSSPAQRKATALHAWALVHGLAQLVLDQQIPTDWALLERVLSGFAALLQPQAGNTAPAPAAVPSAAPAATTARRRAKTGTHPAG